MVIKFALESVQRGLRMSGEMSFHNSAAEQQMNAYKIQYDTKVELMIQLEP